MYIYFRCNLHQNTLNELTLRSCCAGTRMTRLLGRAAPASDPLPVTHLLAHRRNQMAGMGRRVTLSLKPFAKQQTDIRRMTRWATKMH